MSLHSYSRCWIHFIWGTLNKQPLLPKSVAVKVSSYLHEYAQSKDIYMKINYVNPDHLHALIDLPTKYSIEEAAKLLKGASSHWINKNDVIAAKFSWGRGYGAFSTAQSTAESVAKYIAGQEEHHRKKTFSEEYESFVRSYGLRWRDDGDNKNR